jgi:hypothetical protein
VQGKKRFAIYEQLVNPNNIANDAVSPKHSQVDGLIEGFFDLRLGLLNAAACKRKHAGCCNLVAL